jgi:hypothetical protein
MPGPSRRCGRPTASDLPRASAGAPLPTLPPFCSCRAPFPRAGSGARPGSAGSRGNAGTLYRNFVAPRPVRDRNFVALKSEQEQSRAGSPVSRLLQSRPRRRLAGPLGTEPACLRNFVALWGRFAGKPRPCKPMLQRSVRVRAALSTGSELCRASHSLINRFINRNRDNTPGDKRACSVPFATTLRALARQSSEGRDHVPWEKRQRSVPDVVFHILQELATKLRYCVLADSGAWPWAREV